MIDIYMLCFNEEKLVQFIIDEHRKNFPNARIIVYDNESTDNSVEIAKRNGCEIRSFKTDGTFNEGTQIKLRNNCWKEKSDNEWVMVVDLDEVPQINEEQLKEEDSKGSTIIYLEGHDFVGGETGFDLTSLEKGIRNGGHDKRHIFKRTDIKEMNYGAGSHQCNPVGKIVYSNKRYKTFHYKWISYEYVRDRHKMYAERLSKKNKEMGWGWHYNWNEKELRKVYESLLGSLIKIK